MGPSQAAIRRQRQAVLHEEINRLPTADRTAVILCGLEGRPIEQVARELGCPASRLKRRFFRALTDLRASMRFRCGDNPQQTWNAEILRESRSIVPRGLIESTVAAATGCRAPGSVPGPDTRACALRVVARSEQQ